MTKSITKIFFLNILLILFFISISLFSFQNCSIPQSKFVTRKLDNDSKVLLKIENPNSEKIEVYPPSTNGMYLVGTQISIKAPSQSEKYKTPFKGWSGTLENSSNELFFIINQDTTLYADYFKRFKLNLINTNETLGTVEVTTMNHNTDLPIIDPELGILENSKIVITFKPKLQDGASNGHPLSQVSWSGDVSKNENSFETVINHDISITAHVTPLYFLKTVSTLIQPNTEDHWYPEGTEIIVKAIINDSDALIGWSTNLSQIPDGYKNDNYAFKIDKNTSLIPLFNRKPKLTLRIDEDCGAVSVSPKSSTGYYEKGTEVILEAHEDSHCLFDEWSRSSLSPLDHYKKIVKIKMDFDQYLYADFQPVFNLTISQEGSGHFEYTYSYSDGYFEYNRINVNAGTYKFEPGTQIKLRSVADDYWSLKEWMGDFSSTQEILTFKMDKDISLKAIFLKSKFERVGQIFSAACPGGHHLAVDRDGTLYQRSCEDTYKYVPGNNYWDKYCDSLFQNAWQLLVLDGELWSTHGDGDGNMLVSRCYGTKWTQEAEAQVSGWGDTLALVQSGESIYLQKFSLNYNNTNFLKWNNKTFSFEEKYKISNGSDPRSFKVGLYSVSADDKIFWSNGLKNSPLLEINTTGTNTQNLPNLTSDFHIDHIANQDKTIKVVATQIKIEQDVKKNIRHLYELNNGTWEEISLEDLPCPESFNHKSLFVKKDGHAYRTCEESGRLTIYHKYLNNKWQILNLPRFMKTYDNYNFYSNYDRIYDVVIANGQPYFLFYNSNYKFEVFTYVP